MQRMKSNYEDRYRFHLTRRTPIIIRLDGKAFHTYTKNLNKPFDIGLIEDMQNTTKFLCENIQGTKIGYTQSDEISILITDYDTIDTAAWFDYNVQKICSISSSLATAYFNQLRREREIYKLAYFDSRVFNIPREEVSNYFLARQKDAVRNSISMLAQSLYSHKQLEYKNINDMQEMCFQKGYNWNDLEYYKKRGSTIIKNNEWINIETPLIFTHEYFEQFVNIYI
jgi:tRNA(His) 5'-end guanylyltransferase